MDESRQEKAMIAHLAKQVVLVPRQSPNLSMTIPISGRHQLLTHIHQTQKILYSYRSPTSSLSIYSLYVFRRQIFAFPILRNFRRLKGLKPRQFLESAGRPRIH